MKFFVYYHYFHNPANEYAMIEAVGYRIDKVELFNLLGQKLFESEVNNSTTRINTTNLLNGTYFVKVYINNTTITKKVTINK
ncbi:MAG: T9SS type A sorting domain-containing protein [Bacteroidota bacterium]|nr:T9SS type A sorting domain-containing protein [Bacteroidota bacterium]